MDQKDIEAIKVELNAAYDHADKVRQEPFMSDFQQTQWHLVADCLQNIDRIVRKYLPSSLE